MFVRVLIRVRWVSCLRSGVFVRVWSCVSGVLGVSGVSWVPGVPGVPGVCLRVVGAGCAGDSA